MCEYANANHFPKPSNLMYKCSYSYGLLSVSLLNGGGSPFTKVVLGNVLDEDARKQRIRELKAQEGVGGVLERLVKSLALGVQAKQHQALFQVLHQTIQLQPSKRSLPRVIESLKSLTSARSIPRFVVNDIQLGDYC
jgi:hypothetical protein